MNRALAFFSLFTSLGTIMCCALPALFVVIGFGAAFAGLVGTFPQLIWLSEHKLWIFGAGAVFLLISGFFQWKVSKNACPTDPALSEVCSTTKDWSKPFYFVSVGIYLIGVFFAFVAPLIF